MYVCVYVCVCIYVYVHLLYVLLPFNILCCCLATNYSLPIISERSHGGKPLFMFELS